MRQEKLNVLAIISIENDIAKSVDIDALSNSQITKACGASLE